MDEFLLPQYTTAVGGTTIANVPATLAQWFDVDFAGLPPLPESHWHTAVGGRSARRVVLITLDALGQNLIEHTPELFAPWLDTAVVNETITSVFPSTTVNALSCLWTGVAPADHGLIGLNLYFPQFGTVGQMLAMSPALVRVPNALLEAEGGLSTETFLPVPSVGEQLARAGIPTYAYRPYEIKDSVLSQMHGRGVEKNSGVFSLADMLQHIRHKLETSTPERFFISAYWPVIDTLSHVYGPFSPHVTAELRAIVHQIQTLLLDPLSAEAWRDTIICLVADHGQSNMPHHLFVDSDPDLQRLLLIENSGEPRTPYLYARQGQKEALHTYLRTHFEAQMIPLTAEEIVTHGLLGPQPPAPEIAQRLGDVVPLMHAGWGLIPTLAREKIKRFVGMHGGLTPDEMRVPWLVWRK